MTENGLPGDLPGFNEPLAESSLSRQELVEIGESMAERRGVPLSSLQ